MCTVYSFPREGVGQQDVYNVYIFAMLLPLLANAPHLARRGLSLNPYRLNFLTSLLQNEQN